MNGWLDLNEILYLEETHVSELLFQIPTRSFDIGGSWRGKPEILENAYKCRRYVIDVTGLDPISLVELGDSWLRALILNPYRH